MDECKPLVAGGAVHLHVLGPAAAATDECKSRGQLVRGTLAAGAYTRPLFGST